MIETAVVLDAAMPFTSARQRLEKYPGKPACIVRSEAKGAVRWYIVPADEILARKEQSRPLGDAISLAMRDPALVAQFTTLRDSVLRDTVVLDGTDVLGIVRAPAQAAPQRRRAMRSGDSAPTERLMMKKSKVGAALESLNAAAVATPSRFLAWPKVSAPPNVAAGHEMTLTIALTSEAIRGAMPIDIEVAAGVTQLKLSVNIAAVDFDAPKGWSHTIDVTVGGKLPEPLEVPLRARAGTSGSRLIHVAFLYNGIVCGNATCTVSISETAPAVAAPPPAAALTLPAAGDLPADLTVFITKADGNSATGKYIWKMSSPHDINVDATPFEIDLGEDAQSFARTLMKDVVDADTTSALDLLVDGLGTNIADHIPKPFWDALRAAGQAVAAEKRPPAVLIFSAESFVPWELAYMEEPRLDAGRPPYLAAQAVVGRWIHSQTGATPPPSSSLRVEDIAVMALDYANDSSLAQLPEAAKEATYLVEKHQAIRIEGSETAVNDLLRAKVNRADGKKASITLLHVACHGESDPTNPGFSAIYIEKDRRLTPGYFVRAPLASQNKPLLFLNACQVGTTQRLLGDNAGFAGSSLRGGCRGFVAPLWSVNDGVARQIAQHFYDRAIPKSGAAPSVGEILRDIRQGFTSKNEATYLAYIYYGHPRLQLTRS